MSVEIRLLGGFSVSIDGSLIGAEDFERRAGAELVQLLALTPGRSLHREQVLDALWPDAELKSAANRLNKAATFARNALSSPDAVVVRDGVVALFPGWEVSTDVDVVEGGDDGAALAAYAGDLLPGALYAQWTIEARDRLRQRHLDRLSAAGRWDDVLALEPANEQAHLALIQRALDHGDRQVALARFEQLEHVLMTELGTEPGRAAIELRDRVASEDPASAIPTSGVRTFLAAATEGDDGAWDPPTHDSLVVGAVTDRGGAMVEGSVAEYCAVFVSMGAAVEAAVRLQESAQGFDWGDETRPRLRVALDVGQADHRGGTWSGRVVERVAAIAATAPGDQIVCSAVAAELARAELSNGAELGDLGRFRVPGFGPTGLFRLTAPGLVDRPAPPRSTPVTGRLLETPPTPIFGRGLELDEIADEVKRSPLVTVVGPGGCGKSLLARHLGARLRDRFEGGVWMCELGNVDDGDGVGRELLHAIGGRQHADADVVESIVRSLGARETLLVLDNCEHLIAEITTLATTILDECPQVSLLATSRVQLDLSDEVVRRLPPLDRDSAVELFATEAGRFGAAIDSADPVVARICARLDDLPFAIQLAAARTRSLDLATVESLLAGQLDHLRHETDEGLQHQRTLRTTIAWSFDGLGPELRSMLVDLSVLANRFDVEAAEAVIGLDRATVLQALDELVSRSLIQRVEDSGELRYRLLESVRLFGREEQQDDAAHHRHVIYFAQRSLQLGQVMAEAPVAAFRGFREIWDDLRIARIGGTTRGQDQEVITLLAGCAPYSVVSLSFELIEWCEAALGSEPGPPSSPEEACVLGAWSTLVSYRGAPELGRHLAELGRIGYPEEGMPTMALAWLDMADERLDESRRGWEEIVQRPARPDGVSYFSALIHLVLLGVLQGEDAKPYVHLAEIEASSGDEINIGGWRLIEGLQLLSVDPLAALAPTEESVALSDRHDSLLVSTSARGVLQLISGFVAAPRAAFESLVDTLEWAKEQGMWVTALNAFIPAATLLDGAGEPDVAITLLGARGASVFSAAYIDTSAQLDQLRADNPSTFASSWRAGQRLTPQRATDLALATIRRVLTAQPSSSPGPRP